MQIINQIEEHNIKLEMHALNNLVAEKVEVFLELKHKTVNAALGLQLHPWLVMELSLKKLYQNFTAAAKLGLRIIRLRIKLQVVIQLKKLAVNTLVKTPLETATTKETLKVQDSKSWPSTLLAKSSGLKTSPLLGNLLPPMVTLV